MDFYALQQYFNTPKNIQKTTAPENSHLFSHDSTTWALSSLTLEIERDPV
jgi:hypothetical protein